MKEIIDKKLIELADKKTAAAKATTGKTCPACGIVQGKLGFNFRRFRFTRAYCRHTIECIDLKYKNEFVEIIRMAHNRN